MKDEYEAVQGQVEALTLVLTSLITGLSGTQARGALLNLQAGFDVHCEQEREDRRGDLTRVLIREAVVEAYLGLLTEASKNRS